MSSAAERRKAAEAVTKRVSGKKQESSSCAVIALALVAGLPTLLELGRAFT